MAESPLAHSPTLAAAPPGENASPRLAAGTAVGEYLVDRFLGAGAMGEVYAGHHPVIGKKVAIKVLLATSEEAAERFTREARAVNQVDHPNVIDVFAYGRLDDGRLYLVMDLAPGKSLRARLADGALPAADALAILEPIAEALDAAHERGVVHRDLKPDNIMVAGGADDAFRVFVLDFGIAKLVSSAGAAKLGNGTLTGQGTWLGTPAYMAPEQWSTDGAGPASDRYALGVIAFELLSGSLPFAAASVPGMMEQHFRAAVPALSARGTISTAVDDVIRRALAKDPDARYATARAFVIALRDAVGTKVGATRSAPVRRPWLPAALGIGVLGAGVLGVIAARGGDTDHRAKPASADTPPAGTIEIAVTSTPDGAEVWLGDHLAGVTPQKLAVKPGVKIDVSVRKPGYLPKLTSVTPDPSIANAIAINLVEVSRFEGVWRLPKGVLRAFQRKDNVVDVYKLDTVEGSRTFFKHYAFVPAETGVAFAADDEIVDERGTDASCHVPVHVEYRYDPQTDELQLLQPHVDIDIVDGHCVARAQAVTTNVLKRADGVHDSVHHDAPVGKPTNLLPSPFKGSKGKTALKKPPSKKLDLKAQEQDLTTQSRANLNADDLGTMSKQQVQPDTGKQAPQEAKQQEANPPPQQPPPPQQYAPNPQIAPKPKATPPQPQAGGNEQRLRKAE
jgi:serine/threonine-protein kinase